MKRLFFAIFLSLSFVYGFATINQQTDPFAVDSLVISSYIIPSRIKKGITGSQCQKIIAHSNPNAQFTIKNSNEFNLLVRIINSWNPTQNHIPKFSGEMLYQPIVDNSSGKSIFFKILIFSKCNSRKEIICFQYHLLIDHTTYTSPMATFLVLPDILMWYLYQILK